MVSLNFSEAMESIEKKEWIKVMEEEMSSLMRTILMIW